ncbi:hypothetical protein C8Q78DRAFT_309550 [Trametes maxima]|nr:hypothetical protein C8Q78DRAFT_309550 [Trametes maxima]
MCGHVVFPIAAPHKHIELSNTNYNTPETCKINPPYTHASHTHVHVYARSRCILELRTPHLPTPTTCTRNVDTRTPQATTTPCPCSSLTGPAVIARPPPRWILTSHCTCASVWFSSTLPVFCAASSKKRASPRIRPRSTLFPGREERHSRVDTPRAGVLIYVRADAKGYGTPFGILEVRRCVHTVGRRSVTPPHAPHLTHLTHRTAPCPGMRNSPGDLDAAPSGRHVPGRWSVTDAVYIYVVPLERRD